MKNFNITSCSHMHLLIDQVYNYGLLTMFHWLRTAIIMFHSIWCESRTIEMNEQTAMIAAAMAMATATTKPAADQTKMAENSSVSQHDWSLQRTTNAVGHMLAKIVNSGSVTSVRLCTCTHARMHHPTRSLVWRVIAFRYLIVHFSFVICFNKK